MRSIAPLTVLALATIAGACASTGSSGASGSSDVITQEQLQDNADMTAFEVVRRLRPQWLRVRGGQTGRGVRSTYDSPMDAPANEVVTPRVIQDGVSVSNNTSYLERISASQLREIRFLDSREATTRYGTGYPHGAIEIITAR